MQSQMERERQRLAIEERKAEEYRRLLEEQEKEKLRNEKRAAKERRREARVKEDLKKQQDRLKMSSSMSAGPFNGQGFSNGSGNSSHNFNEYQANKGSYIDMFDIWCINYNRNISLWFDLTYVIHIYLYLHPSINIGVDYKEYKNGDAENGGFCRSLLMLLLALLLVTIGSGISLLFIYTGGNLDQQSIERALPVLQNDVEYTLMTIGHKVEFVWQQTQRTLKPFVEEVN